MLLNLRKPPPVYVHIYIYMYQYGGFSFVAFPPNRDVKAMGPWGSILVVVVFEDYGDIGYLVPTRMKPHLECAESFVRLGEPRAMVAIEHEGHLIEIGFEIGGLVECIGKRDKRGTPIYMYIYIILYRRASPRPPRSEFWCEAKADLKQK